ncbi:hypothetical protein [Candidatus Tisiphia endosymbiont of Neophilaenus lineatus]|uniref:hypothetical protein n=1 Tax=Candidatus Tisiphia endosymbiont of Neophilaenus lineatus TaxID=3139336 RepID=UPI0035CB3A39
MSLIIYKLFPTFAQYLIYISLNLTVPCEIVIPPKSNRKVQREYDKHTYKERYLIEC